jgi:hypothetical protein
MGLSSFWWGRDVYFNREGKVRVHDCKMFSEKNLKISKYVRVAVADDDDVRQGHQSPNKQLSVCQSYIVLSIRCS